MMQVVSRDPVRADFSSETQQHFFAFWFETAVREYRDFIPPSVRTDDDDVNLLCMCQLHQVMNAVRVRIWKGCERLLS
jgi:hypothetical protein